MIGWIFAGILGIFSGIALALFLRIRELREMINGYLKDSLSKDLDEDKKQSIETIVKNYRNLYKKKNKGNTAKSVSGLGSKSQFNLLTSYLAIVFAVADVFFPNDKDAYLNFSLKGGFDSLSKVIKDLENLLNASKIFSLKGLNVSIVMLSLKIVIGIKSNKHVEMGSFAVKGVGKVTRVINIVNPFYWIRKATLAVFISMAVKQLALAGVDIVAWEVADFYDRSKRELEKK